MFYHIDHCHNNNNIKIPDKEVNEILNLEVTFQDDEDRSFDNVLINIVKGYPLYDCSCRLSRCKFAYLTYILMNVCCNRWTRLKESFSKEKKRQNETTSGSGAFKRRGFVYFESMKFIDKFVKTRK
ncbi:hypothetical protein ACFW04_014239 [Cataglyphis niger]